MYKWSLRMVVRWKKYLEKKKMVMKRTVAKMWAPVVDDTAPAKMVCKCGTSYLLETSNSDMVA